MKNEPQTYLVIAADGHVMPRLSISDAIDRNMLATQTGEVVEVMARITQTSNEPDMAFNHRVDVIIDLCAGQKDLKAVRLHSEDVYKREGV